MQGLLLGPSAEALKVGVIRAVTVRYIRRWLVGWLLFRCLAPGFAGRALVLGNRPTCAGRFRFTGGRCGRAGGAFCGRRNRKRGRSEKIRMKRKGGARITRSGPPRQEDPWPPPSSCRLQVSRCRWREVHCRSGSSGLSARSSHGRPLGGSCIGHGFGATQAKRWQLSAGDGLARRVLARCCLPVPVPLNHWRRVAWLVPVADRSITPSCRQAVQVRSFRFPFSVLPV